VAEVEVDPETGRVEVVRYCRRGRRGNVINPMLVHGQSHGGIMAGIGQALLEHAVYDPESGQFLTATFQDYCMPRASDAPDFDLGFNVVPCPNNDLGVKGAGRGRGLRRAAGHRLGGVRRAGASRISTCR
jgi:carbon-monoxide dehydrogenase large subunit